MNAGITGHQNIGDADAVAWVEHSLRVLVGTAAIDSGLTSLAVGADQLFARVLRRASLPFVAVLPCDRYADTFENAEALASYSELLAASSSIHQLPFLEPTEEAFFAAGKWIVDHCDVLVAVWNGLPARGIGGTGDVVGYARDTGRRWIHVHPVTRTVAEVT